MQLGATGRDSLRRQLRPVAADATCAATLPRAPSSPSIPWAWSAPAGNRESERIELRSGAYGDAGTGLAAQALAVAVAVG